MGLVDEDSVGLTWAVNSKIPWFAHYMYLAGGVNTPNDWTNWGNVALNFAKDSVANKIFPVLTYYEILQTVPPGTANPSQQSNIQVNNEDTYFWANINNAVLMKTYFENFKTLMVQLGTTNTPVIVHVEPDLFGFMHKKALELKQGDTAAGLTAAIASSGHADVAGLPNTFLGFNQALRAIRQKYAPKVLLAGHASPWVTTDYPTATSSSLDIAQLGRVEAQFMATTGTWDLMFTDVANATNGYWQAHGNAGDGRAQMWDKANLARPNFNGLRDWADAFTSTAKTRLVFWQIPIGNTIMRSVDNTASHFQDNRAEYYLENYPTNNKIQELANVGVVGFMFGQAQSGDTSNFNYAKDGITNPAAINGNNEVAQYSDDDGGYLRTRVANYYSKGAVPIPSTFAPTPISSPTAPAPTPLPTPPPSPPPVVAAPTPPQPVNVLADTVFINGAKPGWDINAAGWDSDYTLDGATMNVTMTAAWSGFSLERTSSGVADMIQPGDYVAVSFDIHPGPTLQPGESTLQVSLNNGSNNVFLSGSTGGVNYLDKPLAANQWSHVRVPIAAANSGNLPYHQIVIKNESTNINFSFYVANVQLEKGSITPPPPPPSGGGSGFTNVTSCTAASTAIQCVQGTFGGIAARKFYHHISAQAAPAGGRPLVFFLHGDGGNGNSGMTSLYAQTDPDGAIVIQANGAGNHGYGSGWSFFMDPNAQYDDVGFIKAIVDGIKAGTLLAGANINPKRVYAIGSSRGGFMVYTLAVDVRTASYFAAINSLMGNFSCERDQNNNPLDPICESRVGGGGMRIAAPVIHIHGDSDNSVDPPAHIPADLATVLTPKNGNTPSTTNSPPDLWPLASITSSYACSMGFAYNAQLTIGGKTSYLYKPNGGCSSLDVQLILISGAGHGFSGWESTSWSFLKAKSKP